MQLGARPWLERLDAALDAASPTIAATERAASASSPAQPTGG
jgi:hypothetical protein